MRSVWLSVIQIHEQGVKENALWGRAELASWKWMDDLKLKDIEM